jgi:hypothetical protein
LLCGNQTANTLADRGILRGAQARDQEAALVQVLRPGSHADRENAGERDRYRAHQQKEQERNHLLERCGAIGALRGEELKDLNKGIDLMKTKLSLVLFAGVLASVGMAPNAAQAQLPPDFPGVTVTTYETNAVGDGYIFLTVSETSTNVGFYAMILKNDGTPVWYQKTSDAAADLKVLPDGFLHDAVSYFDNVRLRRIFTLFLQPAGGRAGTIDEVLGHQLSG